MANRAYGYGLMNSKLNTIESLLVTQSIPLPAVTPDLQVVLDENNVANNVGIQLISDGGLESNYSSTSINFVDNPNSAITTLNNNSLNSFNSTTGKSYNINADGLAMSGSSGTNYTTIGDGILNMTGLDGKYVGLSPSVLDFNGNQGSEGQVLTKDPITNNPVWANLPVSSIPDLGEVLNAGAEANQAIDMSGNNIINVGNITALTETNMSGQFTFNLPPHIPDPILGNDAAPKGYVDSLVGQYAGGFNLFFNYSQTDASYVTFKSLSQLVSSSIGEIVPTTINTGNNFIAQFITEPLGIEAIPVGLWDAFVYGAINAIGGDAHYYFELWKKTALNVDSLLGTSGISPDINASPNNNPTSYSMVLPISTEIPLDLTDRLYVVLYVSYNGSSSKELSTYFEGSYYSFLQTSLNAGTTLLSSNNTWTGTNAFTLPPTTPNQVGTPANTDIVNYGTITDLIEPVVTTLNYYITQTNPLFQYPPQFPSSTIINTYGYYGWQFINAVALRKIDWFFAPDYDMEVQDVLGLYMNYFNVASTSNDDLPFISIYTKPLGSGDIIPGFAHSSMTYIANFTPVINSPYSSFMNITGTQPTPFAYGHEQVGMIQSPVMPNPRGTYTPSMKVLAISVGTNSTSTVNQVNFVMSKVGVCIAGCNNESVLNPFDASQVGSWVGTATSNLNMSVYSIDASANNLSVGTLTSTGLTLGKSGTTTNIQGNLQIAGQPGTSGQFLTSSGLGAVPTWTTGSGGGSWVGTATSTLNMGIYDISGAVLDNSGNTLTVGGNTTTTTIGKATTGITNLQGIVKINNSAGSSGEVLTSTGTSTAPTWQTPTGGNITYFQSLSTAGVGLSISINQIFLPITITVPSITATYLFTSSTSVTGTTVGDVYASIAQQAGATITPAGATNIINGVVATTALTNGSSFIKTTVTTITETSALSFSYIFTPAIVGQRTFGVLMYAISGGTRRTQTLQIIQLTA